MRREKAKNPELIILWGAEARELTVGITRAVGWEVVGTASKDGMFARWDCPEDWALRLANVFTSLREDPADNFSEFATHELIPPRFQELRQIAPLENDEPGLFEVTP